MEGSLERFRAFNEHALFKKVGAIAIIPRRQERTPFQILSEQASYYMLSLFQLL